MEAGYLMNLIDPNNRSTPPKIAPAKKTRPKNLYSPASNKNLKESSFSSDSSNSSGKELFLVIDPSLKCFSTPPGTPNRSNPSKQVPKSADRVKRVCQTPMPHNSDRYAYETNSPRDPLQTSPSSNKLSINSALVHAESKREFLLAAIFFNCPIPHDYDPQYDCWEYKRDYWFESTYSKVEALLEQSPPDFLMASTTFLLNQCTTTRYVFKPFVTKYYDPHPAPYFDKNKNMAWSESLVELIKDRKTLTDTNHQVRQRRERNNSYTGRDLYSKREASRFKMFQEFLFNKNSSHSSSLLLNSSEKSPSIRSSHRKKYNQHEQRPTLSTLSSFDNDNKMSPENPKQNDLPLAFRDHDPEKSDTRIDRALWDAIINAGSRSAPSSPTQVHHASPR